MALTDPTDTLAYHRSRVLSAPRSMAHVMCAQVTQRVTQYIKHDTGSGTSPEGEALWFYGMNHGLSLIQSTYAPLEPMVPQDLAFVNEYYSRMNKSAIRAFYYLLLICTREARHNKSLSTDAGKIAKLFGQPVADFFQSIKGGESSIHSELLNNPPKGTIGNYVKSLQWVFYNSKWTGGFGGKAWGAVADCLVRFVTGEFTAEMMLDTNWTLAHNNGPIFNKGILYGMYSGTLIRILDVQRSGQIPEAILSDSQISGYSPPELDIQIDWMTARFQGKIGDYVDWYMVEALGSVHKYPSDKKQQVAEHGLSDKAPAAEKKAQQVLQAKIAAEKKAEAEYWDYHYEIMPGLVVDKNQRKAA